MTTSQNTTTTTRSIYTNPQAQHIARLMRLLVPELTAYVTNSELVGKDEHLEACVAAMPLLWRIAKERTGRILDRGIGEKLRKAIEFDDKLNAIGDNWYNVLVHLGSNVPADPNTEPLTKAQIEHVVQLAHWLMPAFTDYLDYYELSSSNEDVAMVLEFLPILFRMAINQAGEGRLRGNQEAKEFQREAIKRQNTWYTEFVRLGVQIEAPTDQINLDTYDAAPTEKPVAPKKPVKTPRAPKAAKPTDESTPSRLVEGLKKLAELDLDLPNGNGGGTNSEASATLQ